MNEAISIFIISELCLLYEGLARMMEQAGFTISGTAPGSSKTLEQLIKLKPTVVLIDVGLSDKNSLALTQAVRYALPESKLLLMGMSDRTTGSLICSETGADAYILREADFAYLVETICLVDRAVSCSTSHMTTHFGLQMNGLSNEESCGRARQPSVLTAREREIVSEVAHSLSNKEIAQVLSIEVQTVKNHIHNILHKLQLRNRHQIIHYASQIKCNGPLKLDRV